MLVFISEGLINYSFLFCFLVDEIEEMHKKHTMFWINFKQKIYFDKEHSSKKCLLWSGTRFCTHSTVSVGCKPWVFRPNVLHHRIQNLENYHGMIPSQIDRTDVRHWAIFWIKSQFSREMYFDTVVRNAFFDLIYVVVLLVHIAWTRAKLYIPSMYY